MPMTITQPNDIIRYLQSSLQEKRVDLEDLSSLNNESISFTKANHGQSTLKHSYIVRCRDGEGRESNYMIYLYKEEAAEAYRHTYALHQRMKQAGIPVPELLSDIVPLRVSTQDKPVAAVVHEFIHGYHPFDMNKVEVREVAHNMARIHKLSPVLSENTTIQAPIPRGIILMDSDQANIIFRDGKLAAFIDFDKITEGKFITDIAQAIYRMWEHIDREDLRVNKKVNFPVTQSIDPDKLHLVSEFIEAYNAERPLTKIERITLADEIINFAKAHSAKRVQQHYTSPQNHDAFCQQIDSYEAQIRSVVDGNKIEHSRGH